MIYEYWLAGIEGISNLKKRKLREVYGNGKAIYYIEETNLKKHTFLNEKDIERLKKAKKTVNLEMQWEKSVKKKIKFVPYFSDNYPKKMKVITDPPYVTVLLLLRLTQRSPCYALLEVEKEFLQLLEFLTSS